MARLKIVALLNTHATFHTLNHKHKYPINQLIPCFCSHSLQHSLSHQHFHTFLLDETHPSDPSIRVTHSLSSSHTLSLSFPTDALTAALCQSEACERARCVGVQHDFPRDDPSHTNFTEMTLTSCVWSKVASLVFRKMHVQRWQRTFRLWQWDRYQVPLGALGVSHVAPENHPDENTAIEVSSKHHGGRWLQKILQKKTQR